MELFGQHLSRLELMRHVGSLGQVAGVRVLSFEEGHGRGTRFVEFRTGSGFRFSVLIDRGLDVGPAEYQGASLQWEQTKGYAAPTFYEDVSPWSWLRYGMGGLFNTSGLLAIGDRQTIPLDFNFARSEDFYGIHGHVAVSPASRFNCGETWDGDQCVLWAEGTVLEEVAYGENVSLTRRYEAAVGGKSFRLRDLVRNDGFYSTPHQLLYHFTPGFPIVEDGTEFVHAAGGDGEVSQYSYAVAVKDSFVETYRTCVSPQQRWSHEAGYIPIATDEHGIARVALVNRRYAPIPGGIGVYMAYDGRALPAYTHMRMMGEGLYTVGMEPATNPTGSIPELLAKGYPVMLEPGETREYNLEFGVLAGRAEIEAFEATLQPSRAPAE